MTSLFNNEPEPGADEPQRLAPPSAATAPADEEDEPMLFASSSRSTSGRSSSSAAAPDKEITLGTMTVLGIFFALAVLCAGFFAFGYSTGSKHTGKPGSGALTDASSVPGCKPAPGSLMSVSGQPVGAIAPMNMPYPTPSLPPAKPAAPAASVAMASEPAAAVLPAAAPVVQTPAAPAPERPAARPAPAAVLPVSAPAPAAPAAQPTMVQVAALSHQADADMVAAALKGRGYSVSIHRSSSDPLLHVQLGPYATRKDAEVMRQKLQSDGFNAILK